MCNFQSFIYTSVISNVHIDVYDILLCLQNFIYCDAFNLICDLLYLLYIHLCYHLYIFHLIFHLVDYKHMCFCYLLFYPTSTLK